MTKDALPFGKSVGNRARIYGLNTIGLARRGFKQETIAQLKRVQISVAVEAEHVARARRDRTGPDVDIAGSALSGGVHPQLRARVILRRPTRRVEELVADE